MSDHHACEEDGDQHAADQRAAQRRQFSPAVVVENQRIEDQAENPDFRRTQEEEGDDQEQHARKDTQPSEVSALLLKIKQHHVQREGGAKRQRHQPKQPGLIEHRPLSFDAGALASQHDHGG